MKWLLAAIGKARRKLMAMPDPKSPEAQKLANVLKAMCARADDMGWGVSVKPPVAGQYENPGHP